MTFKYILLICHHCLFVNLLAFSGRFLAPLTSQAELFKIATTPIFPIIVF